MNTEPFKERLEEELDTVTTQMGENTRAPREEDATATEKDELADKIEDLEEGQIENSALTARKAQIQKALDKISDGSYGVCEIGGEPIEAERLEADAAATTCITHKDQVN